MTDIIIRDDFIKLGQALKKSGAVSSGVDAKYMITEGLVKVNNEICDKRGKKLYPGDVISYEGKDYIIKNNSEE